MTCASDCEIREDETGALGGQQLPRRCRNAGQKLRGRLPRLLKFLDILPFLAWHARCAQRGVASPSTDYQARSPAQGVLHRVVRDHFETFRAQAASLRDGEGLPRFVEQEFRDFLRCGCLAGGFARLRCTACGLDRLVPFSCKGRAFCPSCGGRRMAERPAHLVDHVHRCP